MSRGSLKGMITKACGQALRRSGAATRFFRRRSPIIFYHGVWPTGSPLLASLGGITLERLEQDLSLLARHFAFVGLDDLLQHNQEKTRTTRPPLAVCFDDGCDMIRSGAADVLDAAGVRATMFVVTSCVDNRHLMWMHKFQAVLALRGPERLIAEFNRLVAVTSAGPPIAAAWEVTRAAWCWPMARKEEFVDQIYQACDMPPVEDYLAEHRPYMTWAELQAWRARGHAVGLHTHSHPFCDRLAAEDVAAEVDHAAALLRERLDLDAVPFAYPFGNRFAAEREAEVAIRAGLGCMLGVAGISPRGSAPRRLERAGAETGLDEALFGDPLLETALARIRQKPELSVSLPGYRLRESS